MKIKSEVEYKVNNTILGKQLIVGIRKKNSFIKFDKSHIDSTISLIDKLKENEIEESMELLTPVQKQIIDGFEKIGYLDNGVEVKESFNEFNKIGKKIIEISPKNFQKLKFNSYTKFFIFLTMLTTLCLLGVALNKQYIPKTIDYINMSIPEIIFSITCFPVLILGLHEIGHYIMAQFMGIKVTKMTFGWFVIYPIVLVQYEGMHFYSLKRKLTVIIGGIYGNFLWGTIGLVIKAMMPNQQNILLDLWITSHFACILTNLNLWGMTDGYFLVTSITGIMNLRFKGYKFLNNLLCNKKQHMDKQHAICGVMLLALFILGFINISFQIVYVFTLFSINKIIMIGFIILSISFLSIKFILRIIKAF
ncbi:hypothetical protein ACOAKC_02540 [Hathewaya histolytica]|uniref:hypothetical protein n=1 Tax=Hathewaya histolytica TaxID=1498 RepID=UPI003B66D8E0